MVTFTADEQMYWGDYQTFDVMHAGEDCDWSLAKRYRTYIQAVWEVVVGEFGKEFHHRTWMTNTHEQQARPEVYEEIFTDEVPTEKLYLIPSFTQNDRWWHQIYNPTFNLTPHDMMAVCETMDYHAGGNVFPTYPGAYFQAGFESILGAGPSNLKGASFDMPKLEGWDTRGLTAYTIARLSWDYRADPRAIAEDYCAICFGREAAPAMADICLLSPNAYKYGLYIEPVAYGFFNSLPHIRVGNFVADGYPSIDGGREHLEFLRKIYLRCKPWIAETLAYLDHGLQVAQMMEARYAEVHPTLAGASLAQNVADSLQMTRLLIQTNNLYVKTFFAFFRYRETRSEEAAAELRGLFEQLTATREAFIATPGYGYHLFGVDQLIQNVADMLEDPDRAEARLAAALTSAEIEEAVAVLQEKYRAVLEERADDLVKVVYWEGRVDGRDILVVKGKELKVDHLRWDPVYIQDHTFSGAAAPEGGDRDSGGSRIGTDASVRIGAALRGERLYREDLYE